MSRNNIQLLAEIAEQERQILAENESNELMVSEKIKRENRLENKKNKKIVKTVAIGATGISTAVAVVAGVVLGALSGPAAPVVGTGITFGVLSVTGKFMAKEINKIDEINDAIESNKCRTVRSPSI